MDFNGWKYIGKIRIGKSRYIATGIKRMWGHMIM